MPTQLEIIGENIERLIRENGYQSIELFAHEHGIAKGWLSTILRGKKDIRVSGLLRLAEALGVGLEDIYPGRKRKRS